MPAICTTHLSMPTHLPCSPSGNNSGLPSWAVVAKTLRGLHIVDGRNIYRDADLEPFGLVLHGIGRG